MNNKKVYFASYYNYPYNTNKIYKDTKEEIFIIFMKNNNSLSMFTFLVHVIYK